MKLIWFAGLAGLLSTTIANFLKPQKDHRLLTGFNHKFFVDYGLESHFSCLYTIKEVQAMTDYFRPDPYNNTEFRRLLVTIYTPTYDVDCRKTSDIVLPPKSTAHYREVFSQFGIPPQYITDCRQASCTRGEFHGNNGGFFPMIIFSPDYTLSRELYCVQAENMARRGYVVFVLDNPGETSVVEFPNGDVIWGKNLTSKLTPEEAAFHSDVRATDISWLLDQMEFPKDLEWETPLAGDFNKIFIYGHGLGGSTAANALLRDDRIKGGINYDGTVWGEAAEKGISKPFLLIGVELQPGQTCPFRDFYAKIDAPKMHVRVSNTTHMAFTDVPQFLWLSATKPHLHKDPELSPPYYELFGGIWFWNVMEFQDELFWRFMAYMHRGKSLERIYDIEKNWPMEVVERHLHGKDECHFQDALPPEEQAPAGGIQFQGVYFQDV